MDFSDDTRWTLDLGDGIVARATERPDSPLLAHFFAGYDRAFVLPDEREEFDGFKACLAINPQSRRRFGRVHRELVLVVDDLAGGRRLGGANFLATAMRGPADHPAVAVALNYLYVEPEARGRGLSRRLLAAVARLANRAVDQVDEGGWPGIFIEQNDPLRLSAAEYTADTLRAGIDQIDRLRIWATLGARLVDFAYVQPALSAQQQCDDGLAYAVVGFPLDCIHAQYLHDHLESFFGISVLKGGDPDHDPVAAPQLEALRAMSHVGACVPLLEFASSLDRLRALQPDLPQGALRRFARGAE